MDIAKDFYNMFGYINKEGVHKYPVCKTCRYQSWLPGGCDDCIIGYKPKKTYQKPMITTWVTKLKTLPQCDCLLCTTKRKELNENLLPT